MAETQGEALPSLNLIAERVSEELAALSGHAESLDTKAGVVLGFAGVLVGLGTTAAPPVAHSVWFQLGLLLGVIAGLFATASFFPRRYPVLQAGTLRDRYLQQPPERVRLVVLDTEITMISKAANLLKVKGLLMRLSLIALAGAAALMVTGTLVAGGHHG